MYKIISIVAINVARVFFQGNYSLVEVEDAAAECLVAFSQVVGAMEEEMEAVVEVMEGVEEVVAEDHTVAERVEEDEDAGITVKDAALLVSEEGLECLYTYRSHSIQHMYCIVMMVGIKRICK